MGPASHPLPGLQSPPPQFTQLHHKEILPQINLPQNLPLVSNKPFTDLSVKNQDLLRARPSPVPMGRHDSDCGVYSLLVPGRRPGVRPRRRWPPRTQAPCSACLREAGLYCLGQDMRPTTSLFLMLLVTAFLCLGSVASAAPQFTRDTKSFTDTFMAVRCLLGTDRSSVLSRMVATGSVTSGYRLSPAPHTGPGIIFRYFINPFFFNPANSTKIE